eukprot:TRINITY_DN221_c3_g1_i1.p1 TRINITY_DN221_c3_g1~~TRINITY_DN221_c3_g1_i1.p1  ORF type:complete len:265 (+),score=74.96 TRINITY_DN221_c3_g1_i1:114-908(+)
MALLLRPEAQLVANQLASLDTDSAASIIKKLLTSRPELAPPIVNYAVPDLTYPPSRAFTERRATGVIKQINQEKGYGFITCPDLTKVFGNDVFVLPKQLKEYKAGTSVSFAVILSKENKPQAFDVMLDEKPPGPKFLTGGPKGKGKNKGKEGKDGGKDGKDGKDGKGFGKSKEGGWDAMDSWAGDDGWGKGDSWGGWGGGWGGMGPMGMGPMGGMGGWGDDGTMMVPAMFMGMKGSKDAGPYGKGKGKGKGDGKGCGKDGKDGK